MIVWQLDGEQITTQGIYTISHAHASTKNWNQSSCNLARSVKIDTRNSSQGGKNTSHNLDVANCKANHVSEICFRIKPKIYQKIVYSH